MPQCNVISILLNQKTTRALFSQSYRSKSIVLNSRIADLAIYAAHAVSTPFNFQRYHDTFQSGMA